ncbi:hypothetical protein EVAR_56131_1 [Eumeta japonica]|uniref:Uncharacterized protein n=1 Tax=Eumeta variegata TaxID=151549 RepID=A0A4C1Z693_EUMVA|nr:hypothetical protein EVAR_56131_1 [Eumeta japonica]
MRTSKTLSVADKPFDYQRGKCGECVEVNLENRRRLSSGGSADKWALKVNRKTTSKTKNWSAKKKKEEITGDDAEDTQNVRKEGTCECIEKKG